MMQEDHLKLLETRINKAIAFIETLKSREKSLLQEKEKMGKKIESLENKLEEKEERIQELKGSQEFLKEKIEMILGKLESFATIEPEGQYFPATHPENEKEKDTVEEPLVEEKMVDLNKESGDGGSALIHSEETVIDLDDIDNSSGNVDEDVETKENLSQDESDIDQNTLFNADFSAESIIEQFKEAHESTGDEQDPRLKWFGNNPFIDS